MTSKLQKLLIGLCLSCIGSVYADVTVKVYSTYMPKKNVGDIAFKNTKYGLLVMPNLHGLPPGMHGLHLHENPSCEKTGETAGGHFDPAKTGKHLGPYNPDGHLGDLPVLYVDQKGIANTETIAPRLKESDLSGHAIIVHLHGDNYSDDPQKLGGGGARIACGVVEGR